MSGDNLPVVRSISKVPAISADQYSHVGKYAGAPVMACFEQAGKSGVYGGE